MTDLALCTNKACPSRAQCHRFTASPDTRRQTYALFVISSGDSRCADFIDNKNFKPQPRPFQTRTT
jgi:hypothetical protein